MSSQSPRLPSISILPTSLLPFGVPRHFWIDGSKSVNIEDAFKYPITTIPLAIATTDSCLQHSDKAQLRNFLINESKASLKSVPKGYRWQVDGMAAIRSLKPKDTCETFINILVHFVTPSRVGEPTFVGIINDTFRDKSLKEGTRNKRCHGGSRVHFKGVQQHMVQGMLWQKFLHSDANKEDLITLVANYLQSEDGRSKLSCPFVVTTKECTAEIKAEKCL